MQAEADMLSDTARLSPSADADEIVQAGAGKRGSPRVWNDAAEGSARYEHWRWLHMQSISADSSNSAARSERGHAAAGEPGP